MNECDVCGKPVEFAEAATVSTCGHRVRLAFGQGERITHWFGLRAGDKQFQVERREIDGVEFLVIDGVRCSPEVVRAIFVEPCEDRWLRFERQGDTVTVHQFVVRGGVDLAEPASSALGSYLLRRARIRLVGNGVVEPEGVFHFLEDEIEDLDRECSEAMKVYAGA